MRGALQNALRFDNSSFHEPDAFYWPGYMWLWNDVLSKEELIRMVHRMHEVGARTIWFLPMSKSFRPNTMPTYLEPEFLTEEYLRIYREVVEEIDNLNMVHWLNDEPGWPSGSAGGRIVEEDKTLIQKYIVREVSKPWKGEIISIPEQVLSAYLYKGKGLLKRMTPGEELRITEDNLRLELYLKKEVFTSGVPLYPDLLDPRSTQLFLRLSHDVYRKALGEYFGNAIVAFFNDEARVIIPPWTGDLEEDFKEKYGYNLLDYLPSIFNDDDDEDSMKVRIDYFDWWSSRLAEAYFGQIQKWCKDNEVFSIGHICGEHFTLGPRKYGYGHVLRMLRRFDIPGIDTVWRHLFPVKERTVEILREDGRVYRYPDDQPDENHHYPKYASSIAHQAGKPWALTESFAIVILSTKMPLSAPGGLTTIQKYSSSSLVPVKCLKFTTSNTSCPSQ
jgi:hypothetical protein